MGDSFIHGVLEISRDLKHEYFISKCKYKVWYKKKEDI